MQRALLNELPKFDATAPSTAIASDAPLVQAPQVKPRPTLRKPKAREAILAPENGLVLPEVKISVTPLEPNSRPLPRAEAPPVEADVKIDGFATDAARDAQLLKRHLSDFDRNFINRFTLPVIGTSPVARARAAEGIYQSTLAMGKVADQIELPPSPESSAAEDKKIKALYYQLYYSRPR